MPPMAGPQSRCDLNTTHMAWETHSRAIGMTGGVFSPAPHGEDAPRQDGRRGAAAERDATSEQVALGKKIFHGEVAGATCAGCHGADGIGTPVGADLASGTWLWGDGSLKSITDIIRSGVPQPKQHPGAMPPFGGVQLSESDLAALAAYVWAIGHRTKG
jgi:mono/diheme cytochrome c family protein